MPAIDPPIAYRNSRVAAVLYSVPVRAAQPFLEGTGLTVIRMGNHALVNAAWFDYGESGIGPYREFSVGIMASRERIGLSNLLDLLKGKAGRIGAFIVALPVDSEVARAGGVSVYGLPKSKVDFALQWGGAQLEASLLDGTSELLTMQVPLRLGVPRRVQELLVYSRLEQRLLATAIATDWSARVDVVSRPRLKVLDSHHPIGAVVTALGLETARPLATLHGRLQSAILPAPDFV